MESWVILAALEQELVPVARELGLARAREDRQLYLHRNDKREIVACVTGMGAHATHVGLQKAMKHRTVTRLLHVGFAGGLDPALAPGDIVAPQWIIHEEGSVILINGAVPSITSSQAKTRNARQTLLTSDALASDVSMKTELRSRFGAAAVEMESFHLAKYAIEFRLNFTVIRAISDPANMALPREVTQWVRSDGSSNTFAAIGFLAKNPWMLPVLLKLGSHAGKASGALVRATNAWVRQCEKGV